MRRALFVLVVLLLALLAPRSASASVAHAADSRLGDFGSSVDYTYRLVAPRLRLASGSHDVCAGLASGPGLYRFSAFGNTLENTATVEQPLRWKGRWLDTYAGLEVYDMRARQWVPELGTFLHVDAFAFHDRKGTLWSWPNQNPTRWRDPSGHLPEDRYPGMPQDEIQDANTGSGWAVAILAALRFPALGFLVGSGASIQGDNDVWKILVMGGLPRAAAAAGEAAAAEAAAEGAASRQGMISAESGAGAGECASVVKAKGADPTFGPMNRALHVRERLPNGNFRDPTLRGNLQAYGKDVSDIPEGKEIFTPDEVRKLDARLPENPGVPGISDPNAENWK